MLESLLIEMSSSRRGVKCQALSCVHVLATEVCAKVRKSWGCSEETQWSTPDIAVFIREQ